MVRLLCLTIISFFVSTGVIAQSKALLVCGPMLGYVEHREAQIWLEVAPEVTSVQISYHKSGDTSTISTIEKELTSYYDFVPVKITLDGLDMNSTYEYAISLNDEMQSFPYPLQFKTKSVWEYRTPPPAFSFLFGSCAYVNDSIYDRPGKPYGRSPNIFNAMAEQSADFTLWLGDNMYLREADFTSKYGIYYRYTHDRSIPELQKLLAVRPNYAIWDDHDFGPNDSGSSFELKEISLEAFQNFWCNPSYGEWNNPGIYTHFTWSDCDFFLLDGRYHRSNEKMNDTSSEKQFLGEQQMQWLQNALLQARGSFKFICMGNQVLNPLNDFESLRHYQKEYLALLNFIGDHKINGVVFLSGDRHFSEIIKVERDGLYPLFDITSSAFSSGSYARFSETKEANNPNRVVPSAVLEQNYMKIHIAGDQLGERTLNIICFSSESNIIWEYTISQSELKAK